jgi:hypothetical protein
MSLLKILPRTVSLSLSQLLILSSHGHLTVVWNWMPKSAKLRVCFLKETPQLPPLTIDGHVLETAAQSDKVLGLIIQNNLKWDKQIRSTVSKAFKRLYGLRVLYAAVVSLLLILPTYISRLFVLFWNTVVRCGITRYPAICLTNWKECKSVPCALSFPATHTMKPSN